MEYAPTILMFPVHEKMYDSTVPKEEVCCCNGKIEAEGPRLLQALQSLVLLCNSHPQQKSQYSINLVAYRLAPLSGLHSTLSCINCDKPPHIFGGLLTVELHAHPRFTTLCRRAAGSALQSPEHQLLCSHPTQMCTADPQTALM